jgi:hypothetical protein
MNNHTPAIPAGLNLTQEQIDAISGGDGSCTINELVTLLPQLKDAYENLVDFTSYVIERVAGGTANQ